jgi:hypothetical protein
LLLCVFHHHEVHRQSLTIHRTGLRGITGARLGAGARAAYTFTTTDGRVIADSTPAGQPRPDPDPRPHPRRAATPRPSRPHAPTTNAPPGPSATATARRGTPRAATPSSTAFAAAHAGTAQPP